LGHAQGPPLASTHDLLFMITVASGTRTGYEVEDRGCDYYACVWSSNFQVTTRCRKKNVAGCKAELELVYGLLLNLFGMPCAGKLSLFAMSSCTCYGCTMWFVNTIQCVYDMVSVV
jgi:hypothetical protein